MPPPTLALSMTRQVYEAICQRVSSGRFLPGEKLVEEELARELGVSRVPVREALRLLESHGLLISKPFKGAYLMPVSTHDYQNRFKLLRALLVEALRSIAARPPEPDRWAIARRLAEDAEKAAAVADKDTVFGNAGQIFGSIFEATQNRTMIRLVQTLHIQFTVYVNLFSSDENRLDLSCLGRAIGAIACRDFEAARCALEQHLDVDQIGDVEAALEAAWSRRGQPA